MDFPNLHLLARLEYLTDRCLFQSKITKLNSLSTPSISVYLLSDCICALADQIQVWPFEQYNLIDPSIPCNKILESVSHSLIDSTDLQLVQKTFTEWKLSKRNSSLTISLDDWMPDSHSSKCMICSRDFNLLFRRHHCRNCGYLICSKCSVFVDNVRFCLECT
jgi:hypothetical protein